MIINDNVKGFSNAGSGVAHIQNLLYRDGQHEVGHLLGLGHAGVYKDGVLDQYGDGKSVMGRFPSPDLTAPQYYSRGWLFEEEAAIYRPGETYELRRITDLDKRSLATVIVKASNFKKTPPALASLAAKTPKPPKPRDAFLSFPPECDGCIAIHLSNGSSSQKIVTFGSEYYDDQFTGLHVKILDKANGKVKIAVDFETPTAKK